MGGSRTAHMYKGELMLITSSLLELKEGEFEQAKRYLAELPCVEVRGVSDDKNRILLIIETEDGQVLEKISEEVRKHPSVISLLHTGFYFDEDE